MQSLATHNNLRSIECPPPVVNGVAGKGIAARRTTIFELQGSYRNSLWIALFIVSAVATLPVWISSFPPMADLPQHAAQVALLRNLQDPQFRFSGLFSVNWFTPYLLGYMLIYVLSPLMGIVAACKLVISISLTALPLSTALLMEETGTDKYWSLLSIPAMYGFSYYWGLLNFIVATPLGIVFLWALMRYIRSGSRKHFFWIAALLNLLFFCHALICAFVAVIGVCYAFAETKSFKRTLRISALFGTALPIVLFWLYMTHQSHPPGYSYTRWDLGWFDTADPYYSSLASWAEPVHPGWGRISGFVPRLLGVEPRLEYVLVAAALIVIPLLAGSKLTRRFAVWTPLLVCALVLLFAPNLFLGTAFVFQRFTAFALPFSLITLMPSPSPSIARHQLLRVAGLLIVACWIAAICVRTQVYDRAAEGFNGALAAMEPNQRVLALDFERDSTVTIAPSFAHYASWYAAEKRGVVDPSSAFWYVELIRYKPGRTPRAKLWDFEWNPGEFSWDLYNGNDYRYFLVSSLSDNQQHIFQNAKCPIRLKYSANIWWLYEQDPECQRQNAALAPNPTNELQGIAVNRGTKSDN